MGLASNSKLPLTAEKLFQFIVKLDETSDRLVTEEVYFNIWLLKV